MASIQFLLRLEKSLHQKLSIPHLFRIQKCLWYFPTRPLCLSHCRHAVPNQKYLEPDESVFKRTWKKIKFYTIDKARMKVIGYYLYETIADKIPYFKFFQVMSMPDTFNSWFLITELHVWMLMVKAMELGKVDGIEIRNCIVEAMWADVMAKGKKLGAEHAAMARQQIKVLNDQFHAAILAYDEGLLTDDKVFASALWRRFFEKNCDDPEKVEAILKYVRHQIHMLDKMSEDDFRAHKINWVPFEDM